MLPLLAERRVAALGSDGNNDTAPKRVGAGGRTLLAGLIPDAQVKIYADSAHGFLFRLHAGFAADIDTFLAGAS